MKFSPGCNCCGPCANICVTVQGCDDGAGRAVPGAVVTISKGAYSDSCNVGTGVTAVTITAVGTGYTSAPTVSFSGGGGSGTTATANLGTTTVNAVTLTSGGSNYTTSPSVVFSGGGGTGASATARLGPSAVASLNLLNGGSGYSSTPTVTLTPVLGTGGTGATATATLTGTVVTSLTLTNGGSGYTTAPAVSFSGGGGFGASGNAGLVPGPVATLTKNGSGGGYTTAPTISFSGGGGGSGATATATLNTFGVASVTVTNGGSGYTTLPTVSFSGGGGSGTTAKATLVSKCCIGVTDGTGTYNISVSATKFNTATSTQVVSTCAGSPTLNKTLTLAPASGYHCGCCSIPWPDTLNTNHGFTLTYSAAVVTANGISYPGWLGCQTTGGLTAPIAIVINNGCNYAYCSYVKCDFTASACIADSVSCPANCCSFPQTAGLVVQCDPLVITINWQFSTTSCADCPGFGPYGAWPYYPTTTITP